MILAILQARCSSTRLPGKILKPILGSPMLARQLERVRRALSIDRLLVATSLEPSDDPVEQLCQDWGIGCFRGQLDDVLDRFYQAARSYQPEHVVRLTGDCPLADPKVIDQVVACHLAGGFDYTSNAVEPTYPDGLDVEVFRFPCLEQAWQEARLPSERQHVTPYISLHPERYKIGSVKDEVDLSMLRWTVDEPLDYELVARIYAYLYPRNPMFSTPDILLLLEEHPELKNMNTIYERNEGFQASLVEDALYLQNVTNKKG